MIDMSLQKDYQLKIINIATEYYKLCNTRINKNSTKYISSFIDEYIKLQELQKNCIWNKNNYSMNIDLITSE